MPYLRARAQDYYERLGGARNAEDGAEPEIVAVSRVSFLSSPIPSPSTLPSRPLVGTPPCSCGVVHSGGIVVVVLSGMRN